ncbi:hypothetical protein NMY22_g19988 [Coprinellus aureogranulatus]|nr:hypothetical protein NMY22_g19988 [Coprinellus aureogranulatus]
MATRDSTPAPVVKELEERIEELEAIIWSLQTKLKIAGREKDELDDELAKEKERTEALMEQLDSALAREQVLTQQDTARTEFVKEQLKRVDALVEAFNTLKKVWIKVSYPEECEIETRVVLEYAVEQEGALTWVPNTEGFTPLYSVTDEST